MRTKRSADGESRPAASLAAPVGATLPSESDVLQQYKNASLEFGSGCPKEEHSSHSIHLAKWLPQELPRKPQDEILRRHFVWFVLVGELLSYRIKGGSPKTTIVQ